MADRRSRRRGAPKRTLIAPLVMLACGVATSALVWRLLMLEPRSPEALSPQDQHALEHVLAERARP